MLSKNSRFSRLSATDPTAKNSRLNDSRIGRLSGLAKCARAGGGQRGAASGVTEGLLSLLAVRRPTQGESGGIAGEPKVMAARAAGGLAAVDRQAVGGAASV